MGIFIKAVIKCDGRGYGNRCEELRSNEATLSVSETESTICYDGDGGKNTLRHMLFEVSSAPEGWRINIEGTVMCPTCVRENNAARERARKERIRS